ncbi:MAG: hypothetical protein AAGB12_03605 [Pseudomonadota bacterium]
MDTVIIPQTYNEWHHCITVICNQPLTPKYIEERIHALSNPRDFKTQQFVKLYGEEQRIKTLEWFKQAKSQSAIS